MAGAIFARAVLCSPLPGQQPKLTEIKQFLSSLALKTLNLPVAVVVHVGLSKNAVYSGIPTKHAIKMNLGKKYEKMVIWGWVKPLVPSEPQNSW
jgi:hypothetical protein